MKKSIFILAALFAATFANAQIYLEHSFNKSFHMGWGLVSNAASSIGADQPVVGNYFYEEQNNNILIYNAENCELIKTITRPEGTVYAFISQGIFTTDSKWAFVVFTKTNEPYSDEIPYEPCKWYYTIKVMTEDGTVLANLLSRAMCENVVRLIKTRDSYKLVVETMDYEYDVYSLPGKGEDVIITPSSPKRSSRKIARDGQVLVETEQNTYTLTGAEVK